MREVSLETLPNVNIRDQSQDKHLSSIILFDINYQNH